MTLRPLTNRDFKLPSDEWYQVVPLGTFSHASGVTQVIDGRAAESMVNRFRAEAVNANFPGLLVDYDHFSDDEDKASSAAGWITDLQNRTDGVWAQIRWSKSGRAAVEGGDYRLVSPVFEIKDTEKISNQKTLRPLRLAKVALTNDPNLRGMVPLSNRQAQPAPNDGDNKTTKEKRMKSVCALLGLSAEADEMSVHAAVTQLQNRVATSEKATGPLNEQIVVLKAANESLLTAQVESDLEKYKNRYKAESKEAVKKQLLANRAATIELLEAMPEAAEVRGQRSEVRGQTQTIHNRNAKGPAPVSGDAVEAEEKKALKIKNRAHELFTANKARGWDSAWSQAVNELETV